MVLVPFFPQDAPHASTAVFTLRSLSHFFFLRLWIRGVCGPPKGASFQRLGVINQAVMDCVKRELEAVGDAELIENVVEMILNGLL